MLRRKLILFIAPLVLLLLGTTAASIWFLQGVLEDLRHVKESAWVAVEDISELSVRIQSVQVHLYELQTNRSRRLDPLIDEVEACDRLIQRMGSSYLRKEAEYQVPYAGIQRRFPQFRRHVSALATAQDDSLARQHNELALEAAVAIQQETLPLGRMIHHHAQGEQETLLTRFRWLVLGMALVFLLVINVAVVLLLRTASIILKPIDRLVAATHELAAGKYDYRVQLDQQDEFGQLARAYNDLAQQLQSNEKRQLEVLGHVSLTMNHEINNAVAIIQMQLQLLKRQPGPTAQTSKCLQQIHQSLERMTRTVQSLKEIRRIVLTEYVEGVKMLDLAESVKAEPPAVTAEP